MTIYEDIASAVLGILPALGLSVGGNTWSVYRNLALSPGNRTLYVLRNQVDKRIPSLAGTTIYSADWVVFAELGQDIAAQDIIISTTDTTRIFQINGEVTTDLAMLFAPCVPTRKPV